ncbi:hypothetical protein [Paraglaciecola sp. L3A3]|uniref:hypothetical protein n=1 Tax=Paraglaciecola sp. L3A3 TaxID=2686358 RepID=UPI001E5B8A41|nr:hypothetical protein [Paraglaciecola sp. L3A3]
MNSTYEEEFMGFEIFVEPNPDKWQGGYIWTVCKDEEEIYSDLEFEFDDAINSARSTAKLYF